MKKPKASFTKFLKDHCGFPVSPWCSLDGLSHPIMAVINLIQSCALTNGSRQWLLPPVCLMESIETLESSLEPSL